MNDSRYQVTHIGDSDDSDLVSTKVDSVADPEDDIEDDDALAEDEDIDDELSEGLMDTIRKGLRTHIPQENLQTSEATAEELARFRAEWQADLDMRHRHAEPVVNVQSKNEDIPGPSQSGGEGGTSPSPVAPKRSVKPVHVPPPVKNIASPSRGPGVTEPLLPQHAKALDVYRRAVTYEQRGELDEALRLYRRAFRLHEDVARLYDKQENISLHIKSVEPSSIPHQELPPATNEPSVHQVLSNLEMLHVSSDPTTGAAVTLPANHGVVTGTLANIMAPWELLVLAFEPENEQEPVHLQKLPDELLVHILEYLGTNALERFALVDRKARVVSLDSTLWRRFVVSIYQSPQISEAENLRDLAFKYKGDFRRLYIEHPRVRLDGVYIAVCHYIRNGLSENAWVNVSHLITYHRYLRFYPDGQVLSLLANEEVAPQQVIPILNPSLRMKGFFVGNWRLEGTTVFITDLANPSGDTSRYTFQMILELKSRPLGRWNRLDFVTYDSVSVTTGETAAFPLKNDRPFWFSKVRSYT